MKSEAGLTGWKIYRIFIALFNLLDKEENQCEIVIFYDSKSTVSEICIGLNDCRT